MIFGAQWFTNTNRPQYLCSSCAVFEYHDRCVYIRGISCMIRSVSIEDFYRRKKNRFVCPTASSGGGATGGSSGFGQRPRLKRCPCGLFTLRSMCMFGICNFDVVRMLNDGRHRAFLLSSLGHPPTKTGSYRRKRSPPRSKDLGAEAGCMCKLFAEQGLR